MGDITYCCNTDCYNDTCSRHQNNAPKDRDINIADLNDGYCFIPVSLFDTKHRHMKERLAASICRGIQNTNHKCPNPTKALCGVDGDCFYCSKIAEAVLEDFKDYREGEAYWVNVTKPGQITCGGNPVYACGRCGDIYGSHEIFPSANYCRKCGAKMKFKTGADIK